MKHSIALLISVLFFGFNGFTQNPFNITKNSNDNGNKTYVAQDNILFLPGYQYNDNQSRLHAYIDKEIGYQSMYSNTYFDQLEVSTGLAVGATPGVWSISEAGAGGYNVPIQLPAGSNKMQVSLGLSYSSQRGNGIMGIGWDLTGLSSIKLAQSTFYHDNETENVELDGEDRFVLDGSRLFLKSGNYGQHGATYSTEVESYVRLTSYGWNGTPDWFRLETKDGLTMEYGSSDDSRLVESGGKAVEWHLKKIYDTHGNYVEFDYWNEGGTHRLERILFTGNDEQGVLPYNVVKFKYGTRSDKNSYFVRGKEVQQNHLLNEISIFSDGDHFKTYKFNYGLNLRSYMQSITEFGANNEQLNSTNIKYGDPGQNLETLMTSTFVNMSADFQASRDYNGDGRSDLLVSHYNYDGQGNKVYYKWEVFVSNGANSFSHYAQGSIPSGYYMFFDSKKDDIKISGLSTGLDFWGDGSDDVLLVRYSGSSSGFTLNGIQIIDINGLDNTTTYSPSLSAGGYINLGKYLHIGDFDGDGRDDILLLKYGSSSNLTYYGKLITLQGGEQNVVLNGLAYLNAAHQIHPSDFDGDGKREIMVLYDNSCEIFEFQSQPQSGIYHVEKIYHSGNPGFPTRWHTIIPGDFNGDGKTDILTSGNNSTWEVAYSNGVNFISKSFSFQTNYNPSSTSQTVKIGDFNGDGTSDIVHAFSIFSGGIATTSKVDIYYSTGLGFVHEGHVVDLITSYGDFGIGDFNGDGKNEIFNRDHYQQPSDILYFHRDSKEHFAEKIKDGYGRVTSYNYSWLPRTTNYTNGSVAGFPIIDKAVAIPVVLSIVEPNGNNGTKSTNYKYQGAKWHQQGAGFLGFETVTSEDFVADLRTITESKVHSDPFIPKLRISVPKSVKAELISTGSDIFEINYTYSVTSISGIHVKVNKIQEEEIDYLRSATSVTTTGYDNFGNITTVGVSNGIESSLTTNQYVTMYNWWIPSLISSSTVTKTRQGESAYVRKKNFNYNIKGDLISEISDQGSPKSTQRSFVYDAFGNVRQTSSSASGEQSVVSTTNYDLKGRFIVNTKNPLGQETIIEVDKKWGKPTKIIDIAGNISVFEYDGFGNLTSETNCRGITTLFSNNWDITSSSSSTEPNNTTYYSIVKTDQKPEKKTWFDEYNREVRKSVESLGGNIVVLKKYNNRGDLSSVSRPYFIGETPIFTNYSYDQYRRPAGITDGTVSVSYSYSASGGNYTTTMSGPNGTSSKVSDASGKVISASDNGGTINYQYYSNDLNKAIIYDGTQLVEFEYDQYGMQTLLNDVDAGSTSYEYDAYGRLISQTDPNGNHYVVEYDVLGREIKKTGPEGSYITTYIESGNGINQVESVTSPNGVISEFTYDPCGRTIIEKQTVNSEVFISEYEYDAGDNVVSMKYPSGYEISLSYDPIGNLIQVQDDNGNVVFDNPETNAYGKYTSYEFGNGVVTEYSYDPRGLLTGIYANNILDLEYGFNTQNGNLLWKKDHLKNRQDNYTYDIQNRLVEFNTSLISSPLVISLPIEIEYANNGNILSKTDVGIYSYDAPQIHAVTGVDNGNGVVSPNQQNIIYNSFDRVESIQEGDFSMSLEYGTDWDRIKTETFENLALTETRYFIGPYEKLITDNGTKEIHYLPAGVGADAVYILDNGVGSYHYLHRDHLGSVVAVTDNSGVVEFEQNFDAWGNRRDAVTWAPTNVSIPNAYSWVRGFTGHEHLDEFGLINMNNRLYDPVVARMLSPDNFVQFPSNTQGYNRYSYVYNNPLKFTDPTGEFAWAIPLVAAGVFGTANLTIQAINGEINNVGDGFTAFFAGAVAGFAIGSGVAAGLSVPILGTTLKIIGWTYAGSTGVSVLGGLIKGLFTGNWSGMANVGKILAGNFYLDGNRNFFGQTLQGLSRFSWEGLQTTLGHTFAQFKNAFGYVDNVAFFGGATVANRSIISPISGNVSGGYAGLTMGSFILGTNLDVSVNMDEIASAIFMHEYGHTIQSQIWGPLYPIVIGISSGISCATSCDKNAGSINGYPVSKHETRWYELQANRLASKYFNKHYGVTWNEAIGGPLTWPQ